MRRTSGLIVCFVKQNVRNSLKNEEDMNEVPEIMDKNLAMTLNLRTLELMKYARIATARRYLCQQ